MNEKVKAFLDAKKIVEKKNFEEEKRKTLFEAGIYEKVYVDKEDDETFFEYDDNSQARYYKNVPIEVTDEEYEEIKKYTNQDDSSYSFFGKNKIANLLKIIAIVVYVSGFIAGIILGLDSWGDPTFLVVVYWIAFFVVGTVYLGFAEIINLLAENKNK